MTDAAKRWVWRGALLVLAGAAAWLLWWQLQPAGLPEGFAGSNGRIEAVEIDVATKQGGRVAEILVDEGDFVTAGQLLARMDTGTLLAQLREAEAGLQRARIDVETARALVRQRTAERQAALAVVEQRQAELEAAARRLQRTEELAAKGTTPLQTLDDDRARFAANRAALSAAEAQVAAAEAAIGLAESQVIGAGATVEAMTATVERIRVDLDDAALLAPRDGRVQFRVAQPGEVLPAGGKLLNLVDLSDVYMTFFLPTAAAGRLALGAEARIVLDAAPQYVIPASVSYVADVAQFTPKTVETEEERQKLTFRVKASIDPALLRQHIRTVKTGLPGMAYVRLDPAAAWPPELDVRLPP